VPEEPALHQFSVSTARGPSQDDVVTLLYRVADALEALGEVGVVDITYQVDETDDGWVPSMTVFYEIDDEPSKDADVDLVAAEGNEVVQAAQAEAAKETVRVSAAATPPVSNGTTPTTSTTSTPVWNAAPARPTSARPPTTPSAQPPTASLSDRAYGQDENPALRKIKDLWSTRRRDRRP
jgi:hypothetical protein